MTSSKTGTVDKIRATLAGSDGYLTQPISDIALARTRSTLIQLGVASPASQTPSPPARPPSQATPQQKGDEKEKKKGVNFEMNLRIDYKI